MVMRNEYCETCEKDHSKLQWEGWLEHGIINFRRIEWRGVPEGKSLYIVIEDPEVGAMGYCAALGCGAFLVDNGNRVELRYGKIVSIGAHQETDELEDPKKGS